MVYFIVGIGKGSRDEKQVYANLRNCTAGYCESSELKLDLHRFNLGNFDNMMSSYDNVSKLENQCEHLLKRIEKALTDIDPKNKLENLKVERKQGETVDKMDDYLIKFAWDDGKYPRNQDTNQMLKNLTGKVKKGDENLRGKTQGYNEAKTAKLNQEKSKTASMATRDLNDILAANKEVKGSDFITFVDTADDQGDYPRASSYFTNFVAFVENGKQKDFENNYERWSDNIVPGSARKLKMTSNDLKDYTVFIFHGFHTSTSEIISKARNNNNVTVKEYSGYNEKTIEEKRGGSNVVSNFATAENSLKECCDNVFKDIYGTFIHIKALKVVIDSMMRQGNAENFVCYLIKVYKGKDKRV